MKKWCFYRYALEMYMVGVWEKNGNFKPRYQVNTQAQAATIVNYLNGGKGLPLPFEILCPFKTTKKMWVFVHNLETSVFVGYYLPSGKFEQIYEVATQRQAEAIVNYLNGGTGEMRDLPIDPPEPEPEPEPIPETGN